MSLFKYLLFLGLFLCCQGLFAQEKTMSIVYLNDGSFLKGNVISETPFRIEFQLSDGNLIQLSKGNIKSIEKIDSSEEILENGNRRKNKGHYNVLNLGLLFSQNTRSGFTVGANVFHYVRGYQFNPHFALGGGLGLDLYQRAYLPIFIDIRGKILNRSISLYYALNAGYTVGISKDEQFVIRTYKGGFMFHPSIGLHFSTQKKFSFLIDVGYRQQYATTVYSNEEEDKWIFRRISVRAGIMF